MNTAGNLEYGTPEMLNLLGYILRKKRDFTNTILRDIIKNGKRRF
jgi:hypothetical protein